MKVKILILVMLSVFKFSCKNNDVLGLTSPDKKWVYHNSEKKYDKSKIKFLVYLKFYPNGECVNLFFNKNSGQYGPSMDWKFVKSDSILSISDNHFLILKVYSDSIIMKDLKYNRNVKMLNRNVLEK